MKALLRILFWQSDYLIHVILFNVLHSQSILRIDLYEGEDRDKN